MIKVQNTHASMVGGIPAGAIAQIDPETLDRYPWAFRVLDPVDVVAPEPAAERTPARAQRDLIRASNDPDYVRQFIGDGRTSVHTAAVKRLRKLMESA